MCWPVPAPLCGRRPGPGGACCLCASPGAALVTQGLCQPPTTVFFSYIFKWLFPHRDPFDPACGRTADLPNCRTPNNCGPHRQKCHLGRTGAEKPGPLRSRPAPAPEKPSFLSCCTRCLFIFAKLESCGRQCPEGLEGSKKLRVDRRLPGKRRTLRVHRYRPGAVLASSGRDLSRSPAGRRDSSGGQCPW